MRGSSNSREPKDPVPEQGDAADAVWGVGARALYRSSSRLASESLVASRARSGSAPIAVARWARSLPAESAADAAASPCATRRRRPTQVEVPHLALTSSSTIEVPAGTPRVTPRSPARQHTIDFSSGAGRAGSADVATAATGDDDEDDACGVCAQPAAAASAVAYTATLGFYSSPRVGRTLAEPLGGAEPCVVVERRMSVSNGRVAIEEVDTPTTTAMPPPPLLPVVSARSAPVLAESDTQDVAPSKLKDSSDKKRRKKKTKDKKEDKEKKDEKEEKEEHSHKHRHKHEKRVRHLNVQRHLRPLVPAALKHEVDQRERRLAAQVQRVHKEKRKLERSKQHGRRRLLHVVLPEEDCHAKVDQHQQHHHYTELLGHPPVHIDVLLHL